MFGLVPRLRTTEVPWPVTDRDFCIDDPALLAGSAATQDPARIVATTSNGSGIALSLHPIRVRGRSVCCALGG